MQARKRSKEELENLFRLCAYGAGGSATFAMYLFGDHLAAREGYKDLEGLDAIHFFLMEKHHWPPTLVRSLSHDHLQFALHQEMQGWFLPVEARKIGDPPSDAPSKPKAGTGRKVR